MSVCIVVSDSFATLPLAQVCDTISPRKGLTEQSVEGGG